MRRDERTASRIEHEAKVLAYKRVGQEMPAEQPAKQARRVFLPISISIDRDTVRSIREQILWPVGDPDWTPETAASKFCYEMQVNPATHATVVTKAIKDALACLDDCSGLQSPKTVRLKVYVQRGAWALYDDTLWDAAHPLNTADAYAALMCKQLGLGVGWHQDIRQHVAQKLQAVREALRARPQQLQLPSPPTYAARSAEEAAAATLLPRIEAHDEVRARQVAAEWQAFLDGAAAAAEGKGLLIKAEGRPAGAVKAEPQPGQGAVGVKVE